MESILKTRKLKKANKDASSKNHIKKKRSHVLRSTKTRGRKMLTQNVCTAVGCIVKIEEVKYGFDLCSVTAGVTKKVREQLSQEIRVWKL
jgi:hypothetical protein